MRAQKKSTKTRKSPNSISGALALAKKIKSVRSYVDDGVGWVEILFEGNYELAIRFEVAAAVVKSSSLVQYRGGNCRLIKRYKIARKHPPGRTGGMTKLTKERQTVWADDIRMKPISAAEHKRWEKWG